MTREEKLRKLLRDPKTYIERFLFIKTKNSTVERFRLNPPQLKLLATITALREQMRPVRLVILKARQMGFSTCTEAEIYHDSSTKKNRNSLIVAHVEDSSTKLFGMSKLFYEMCDERVRPMLRNNNAKLLLFENPSNDEDVKRASPGLRSSIRVTTAESPSATRSSTFQNVHASEVAFWNHAEEAMLSIMQTVPNSPDTMVVLESTANGIGGYFYDMWQKATAGENDFVPLFFGWHEMPEYCMPVPPDFILSSAELQLKTLYELTDQQLVWRRWCIANNCGSDEDKFKQEYPICPEEAFLMSGRPVFDVQLVHERKKYLAADKQRTVLQGELKLVNNKVIFEEVAKGRLKIYKPPEEDRAYLIAADVAEGVSGGNYSVAHVFDRITWEQVASWRGHIAPDMFGDKVLWYLARLYKKAFVAPESNNHGLTTITALRKVYHHIYRRKTVDKITNKPVEKFGFLTNAQTRPLAIDKAVKFVRDGVGRINDMDTLDELLWFQEDDNNKAQAVDGKNDDCVMALAIGCQILEQAPYSDKVMQEAKAEITNDKTGW